ncbi:MAG: metal ABC transporter substrate-binding protein [Gemmatimonadetes bacterium]|nr:metal ABC transporter substrate-binding protein [Gemmatimonadota bacterium]
MKTASTVAAAILAFGIAACGGPSPDAEVEANAEAPAVEVAEEMVLYTTNYPLAYFAERIGGDRVRVEFPVPAGVDPAYWTPSPEEVSAYQGADLILLNGAGYEGWVAKTSLPESKLVNTSSGFEDLYVVAEDAVVHTHGPEGEHEHENVAFTTWLDPELAIEQARAIRDALAERLPGAEADLQAGIEALEADLMAIDARIEAWATALGGQAVLASHPVYQYLARRYELNLRAVHFEPDEVPTPSGWRDLAALMQGHAADWMLWEANPLDETRQRLASDYGVGSVVFAPTGNRPASGDYMDAMRANVAALEALPAS